MVKHSDIPTVQPDDLAFFLRTVEPRVYLPHEVERFFTGRQEALYREIAKPIGQAFSALNEIVFHRQHGHRENLDDLFEAAANAIIMMDRVSQEPYHTTVTSFEFRF